MWVLTEYGNLVHLGENSDVGVKSDLARKGEKPQTRVVVYVPECEEGPWSTLCTCDDEEHGKSIILALTECVEHEMTAVSMTVLKNGVEQARGETSK